MKKIDNFTNVYKMQKTLRFKLIPVGKTEENFRDAKILEIDEKRAENYEKAKKIIDSFFVDFINNSLSEVKSKDFSKCVKEYRKLYFKKDKTDKEKKELNENTKKLRKLITENFSKNNKEIYSNLFKNDKLIKIILDDGKITNEEYDVLNSFDKFTTYFKGFLTNRENVFKDDGKVGSIGYRSIDENLPMFLFNIEQYEKIKGVLKKEFEEVEEINTKSKFTKYGCKIKDVFTEDYYGFCLDGDGISKYNSIIGGYSLENGEKVKGLNEYINLYNQKNGTKYPKLKQLYKQILMEGEKKSFVLDTIDNDVEIYENINEYINKTEYQIDKEICKIDNVFSIVGKTLNKLKDYDIDKIFIDSYDIKNLSQKIYGNWNIIDLSIEAAYDEKVKDVKVSKKKEDEKKKYIKNKKYISLYEIIQNVEKYYPDIKGDIFKVLDDEYDNLLKDYNNAKKDYLAIEKNKENIKSKNENIEKVKRFLEAIKNIYDYMGMFIVSDLSLEVDGDFYSTFEDYKKLEEIISLYNKIRNYITKKPYSLDKIKLNFECPNFLEGWSVSKEKDERGVILIKDGLYYIGIMNKKSNMLFVDPPKLNNEKKSFVKVNYYFVGEASKQIPRIFFSGSYLSLHKINDEIMKIKQNETYKESINDLHALIDYYKDSIKSYENYNVYNFVFNKTSVYNNINKFYEEVEHQGYKITYSYISEEYINEKVNSGELYLFQIYNKDFSKFSKGTKNLHTMYFEQLFDIDNLKDVVYKLNGEAEIFYRKKSIEYKVTHKKNLPLKNKNDLNDKRTSVFSYDLIKDKRFAFDQFEFHVPITLNFKSENALKNDAINEKIKECKNNYIMGIDRGERNLIYVVVIDENGKIVEQKSLNEIVNEYNGQKFVTNYHNLLDTKEKAIDAEKKNWQSIENIKELKEGYISQVVHKLCELVEKYDAIIVLEDLNSGFKNTRIKVGKQVYQKFEKMLIDKLNYFVNKNKKPNECGGLRKAYQLTRGYEGNNKMAFQNGILYYIAPWNTSKIDSVTGFVNLFQFGRINSIKERKEFFANFDSIIFNGQYFEFSFNYDNFSYAKTDYKKEWKIYTNGERIITFRNKNKKSQWDYKTIDLTEEFKKLFKEYEIDINKEIKTQILQKDNKEFFDILFSLFKYVVQMRNSNDKEDYILSPVKDKKGNFFKTEKNNLNLPQDADANGAYNIARKGLMIVKRIKEGVEKQLTVIKNEEWLKFVQE